MSNITPITFEKASLRHKESVFEWLETPHVKEFWDNSQNHKDDIVIFMNGRKEPSPYFDGIFDYWIGLIDNDPYCLVMTSEILPTQTDLSDLWRSNLSKKGKTFSIDFMIGNQNYFGKGLAAPTLEAFTVFIKDKFYPSVDTFFIDPEESNARAKHVYEKSGFHYVADFHRDCNGEKDVRHFLMVKKLNGDTLMPLEYVVEFVIQMKKLNVKVWIDGGWGVDALLGKQSRPHGDLDIAIQLKDAQKAKELLERQGYKEIRRDNEWNFVLGDSKGHEIDFHVFVFDSQGNIIEGIKYPDESLTGTGTIGGNVVDCIEPQHMVQFHTGYQLHETDFQDVSALCKTFRLNYPEGYINFKIVVYGSDEYKKSVELREEILRKPLGLTFLPEELEMEKDHVHISGFIGGKICATAVLVPEGSVCKMQRVAVKDELQNQGVGTALMKHCEGYAREQQFRAIYCHARDTVIPFYLKNGYQIEGDLFDEDGIPHQKMKKILD